MTITIAATQRDALYEELVTRLSGIDSIWHAVEERDFEAADRLGLEFSDALRFLVEDLGWGEHRGGDLELRTPPDVLRRSLVRLRDTAEHMASEEARERAETECRTDLLRSTCEEVLATLDREAVG